MSEAQEYLLYDSKVKLTFSAGSHRYRVSFLEGDRWSQPRPCTGVTTILNVMNKPALVPWAAKLAAEEYAKLVKAAIKEEKIVNIAVANEFIDIAKRAPAANRDKAGDMGTAIHESIEAFHKTVSVGSSLLGPEEMEIVNTATKAYADHWEESGFKALMIEQVVYSKKYDFAGMLDQVVETPSGHKILRDVKTTKTSKWAPKGAYVEMFAQMGGYAQALQEMYDWLPDELEVINVGKDGVIRRTSNKDFGMSVDDAIHYWNSIYTTWYTNKDWEFKFKRA